MHTLHFDRSPNSIFGVVTLQRSSYDGKNIIKVFERLPAASGQRGWTHTDWVNGKSPTPFGDHWMVTKWEPLQFEPKGTPFFKLGTKPGSDLILGPDGKFRKACGLHFDQYRRRVPGTIGCIGMEGRNDKEILTVNLMFDYISKLNPVEPNIRARVE